MRSDHEEADTKLAALVKARQTCLMTNQSFFILHLVMLISSCFPLPINLMVSQCYLIGHQKRKKERHMVYHQMILRSSSKRHSLAHKYLRVNHVFRRGIKVYWRMLKYPCEFKATFATLGDAAELSQEMFLTLEQYVFMPIWLLETADSK